MKKLRVAVLRGGPSPEYDVSLKSGGNVLKNLSPKYEPLDILITKDGTWHVGGIATTPDLACQGVDVIFNAMHGAYGEDGTVQRIMENMHIPYTGSGPLGSALAMNKDVAKTIYKKIGLSTPEGHVVKEDDDVETQVFKIFYPKRRSSWFVKPAGSGSSLGTAIVRTTDDLSRGINRARKYSDRVLVEEVIDGKETTCFVIDALDGSGYYPLPPIEIVKPNGREIFDYDAKYKDMCEERCPGNFTEEEVKNIQYAAGAAHHALGLRHYSRSDFIITPEGKIYILETNSLPGMTEQSLITKALSATGVHVKDFLDHLIALAREGK